MKLRKYTKVFKNKKSADRLFDRVCRAWERSDLSEEYLPQEHLSFDESTRHRPRRFTVTYYNPTYETATKLQVVELYGSSISDVRSKFLKLMADNFKDYKYSVRKISLVSSSGGMKLYKISYTQKKKK